MINKYSSKHIYDSYVILTACHKKYWLNNTDAIATQNIENDIF